MVKTAEGWSVAAAKAQLSKVIDRALAAGPQWITRRGRQVAVIVSAEEWNRKAARKGSLAEFFAASPLRGSDLVVERRKNGPRQPDL